MSDKPVPTEPCPVCGNLMVAIKGARIAVCRICGFKDACC
jgi:hypothetical protein